ncbi:C1 family peptidase [Athalassotoga saccharophila]|uniref:C1 family peptidase n=1 Tax=Athalassotoga saccharophila TaxID=1441386 RepID=UPI0018D7A146|nr:C1 family peptidase [Athalassotoga saccharophila]BBJ28858.1 aminopeptidase C [Athalassotoga saccharophila]
MKISLEDLKKFRENFESSEKNVVAMNAASNCAINTAALNRVHAQSMNRVFSNEIKTRGVTNQKKSGRCWMFAGLNLLRESVADKLNLENFELSQSYQMFYDKLEKANYFLESIIETGKEDLHGRLVMWILSKPVEDGGQWGMFVDLVEKYGVLPKELMDESFQTSDSATMNRLLDTKLREDAMILRKMIEKNESEKHIQSKKVEMLDEIYRILSINMGLPPQTFDYEYKDKDGNFHRIENITPVEFYKEFGFPLEDTVSVINCPTPDKQFMKTYTVQYLGNVIGGKGITYLNLDLKDFKEMAKKAILDGNLTWFTADVGKMMEREKGILDTEIYDFEKLYGTKFIFDKSSRLDYGDSLMTHAMVFTGIDINSEGKITKWKVENSWGDQIGDKGYFIMSDSWFDQYVYEIVVDKKYLSKEMKKALKEKPVILPPWDPMGSVAFAR